MKAPGIVRLYRKKRVWMALCVVAISFLLFPRDVLLAKAAEIYVIRTLQENRWVYSDIERKQAEVIVKNVSAIGSFGNVFMQEMIISCHLSLFPLSFEPSFTLKGATLSIEEESASMQEDYLGFLAIWAGRPFFSPKLQIEEAKLTLLHRDQHFILSLNSETPFESLLSIKEEGESKDFFTANCIKKKKSLEVAVSMTEGRISSLFPLFFPSKALQWKQLDGKMSGSASLSIDVNEGVQTCAASILVKDLALMHAKERFTIESETLQGTLSFSLQKDVPIWKQIELFMTFADTKFLMNQIGFQEALGEFRLHPEEDPYVKMGGLMISRGLPVPFEIEGKGEILEEGASWFEAKTDFFLSQRHPRIVTSFCQNEKGEAILQAEYTEIGKEVVDLVQGFTEFLGVPKCRMEGGEIEGKLFARFSEKGKVSVEFSDCQASNLALFLPKQELFFTAQEIVMSGALEQGKLQTLTACIHKADLSCINFQIKEINSKLEVLDGAFEPSYIEGSYRGMQMSAQILPRSSDSLLHIEGGAYPQDIENWIFGQSKQEKNLTDPVFLALDVAEVAGQARFIGTVRFSGTEEDLDVEGYFPKKLSRRVEDVFSSWNLSLCKGSFAMEKLSISTVLPYFKDLFTGYDPQGSFSLQGSFDPERLSFSLSAVDLSFFVEGKHVFCSLGDVEPVLLSYYRQSKEWEAKVNVNSIFIEDKVGKLSVEVLESTFFYKARTLWADVWRARYAGIEVAGSLYVKDQEIDIPLYHCSGDLSLLLEQAKKQGDWNFTLPVQGDFFLNKEGSRITLCKTDSGWDSSWMLSFTLQDIGYAITDSILLNRGSMHVTADSTGAFSVKNLRGWLDFPSMKKESISCAISARDFYWTKEKKSSFFLEAKEGTRQLLLLEGSIQKNGEDTLFQFSNMNHILGLQFALSPVKIDSSNRVLPFHINCSLKLEYLPAYLDMGKKIGFALETMQIPPMGGDVQMQALWDTSKEQVSIQLDSSNFSYAGTYFGELHGTLLQQNSIWKLESMQIGSYFLKARARAQEQEWHIEEFLVKSPDMQMSILGSYAQKGRKLTAKAFSYLGQNAEMKVQMKGAFEGIFSPDWQIQGKGVLRGFIGLSKIPLIATLVKDATFYIDPQKGLTIDPMRIDCLSSVDQKKCASCHVQKVQCGMRNLGATMQGLQVQVTKEGSSFLQNFLPHWILVGKEGPLLTLDLDFSDQSIKALCSCKNSCFSIQTEEFSIPVEVKNMQLLWQKASFYSTCQVIWNKQPLWMQLKENEQEAIFVVKEHLDMGGLSSQFLQDASGKWHLEVIKGDIKGLHAKVQRKHLVSQREWTYDAQVDLDFSKLGALFPKALCDGMQKMGLGKGYQCRGTLSLEKGSLPNVSFSGDIQADQFQCLGKTLYSLRSKLDWTKNEARIYGLTLEDETGSLMVKTIALRRDPSLNTWTFHAPLIQVKDFSPSLLVKGKKDGPVIKNMSLYDLKGNVKDWKNMTATGLVHFTSLTKKEFSLWDVPKNFIRDLGLDTSLLSPASGEADLTICQGRCYFTNLKNVCSEGGRSQFDLADPSADAYLSLDGNWHVDLQLRQNVVWKLAEDFILSIRGSIEKPKYSFTRKEAFP
jgi:hypothetical protein